MSYKLVKKVNSKSLSKEALIYLKTRNYAYTDMISYKVSSVGKENPLDESLLSMGILWEEEIIIEQN